MKYLSLFTGIGGFELGIGDRGECIGFAEIEKYPSQILAKHFSNIKNYGDIRNIDTDTLPDLDLIVGGFPCQSFSIAGKRRGFDEARGTLFFEIARIAKAKKPSMLLLENVRGLLSHDGGKTFEVILKVLDELGYDAEWCVFDSRYFQAAPRERVYLFAYDREQISDSRKGVEQTTPLYTCFSEGIGNKENLGLEEGVRDARRIIRTFAKLPDWLDSWNTLYAQEESVG